MKKIFEGIIPPMITPLTNDFQLDVYGARKLIDYIIKGGVHGLFILGTTGESTSLSYKIREKLICETGKIVKDRIPVFVGITDTCVEESLNLALIAYESRASAVVAAPPYYFNLGQEELFEYYWELADKLPLPLFLYNMPSLTKTPIEVETAVRLAKHDNIIGLKDSSANTVYFQSLCYAMKPHTDFMLFVGPEEIMAETVLMGGDGGVNGGANLFPKLYVELFNAAKANDFSRVKILQNQVMEISSLLYKMEPYGSSYLKGLKGAVSVLGICENHLAPPMKSFRECELKQISTNLKKIRSHLKTIL